MGLSALCRRSYSQKQETFGRVSTHECSSDHATNVSQCSEPHTKKGKVYIPGATSMDRDAYESLVLKQEQLLGSILAELETCGRKTGHWLWWVFPTEAIGDHDPANTRVTTSTAIHLCYNESTAELWRRVLEKICDLIEQHGHAHVLPRRHHGRIHYFILFWKDLDGTPDWMQLVCSRLDKFEWPLETPEETHQACLQLKNVGK
eukprot:gnl/TRDRNA2_/TRDRNA2_89516_c0_seq2.p1 gnl/TRDRNA2_/TRDRNA2_89516_c0~~gnl/TRDRNA2_/TRDRNA2_89516_c0_seq2.p1  ORF type:complete len:204 (+),score=20.35 gnl/TRDRNA2_/TRDRNA2_89516_c0_seq2:226-837(+)